MGSNKHIPEAMNASSAHILASILVTIPSNERNQSFLGKSMILGLKGGKYKLSMEHIVNPVRTFRLQGSKKAQSDNDISKRHRKLANSI